MLTRQSFSTHFLSHVSINCIRPCESDYKSITCTKNIPEELLCDEDFVLKLLSSLDSNKATGSDKISAIMLKKTATSIAPSVTSLFNQSHKDGHVPLEWKLSHVVPIPKWSPANSPDHYRPVSLLSILSKVQERHVYNVTLMRPTPYQTISGDLEQEDQL